MISGCRTIPSSPNTYHPAPIHPPPPNTRNQYSLSSVYDFLPEVFVNSLKQDLSVTHTSSLSRHRRHEGAWPVALLPTQEWFQATVRGFPNVALKVHVRGPDPRGRAHHHPRLPVHPRVPRDVRHLPATDLRPPLLQPAVRLRPLGSSPLARPRRELFRDSRRPLDSTVVNTRVYPARRQNTTIPKPTWNSPDSYLEIARFDVEQFFSRGRVIDRSVVFCMAEREGSSLFLSCGLTNDKCECVECLCRVANIYYYYSIFLYYFVRRYHLLYGQ